MPTIQFPQVLVTSRSLEEYVAFFALNPDRLPRRVVDCSAGASGFVAGATARGVEAVAVDPAYRLGAGDLADSAREGLAGAADIVAANPDHFVLDWYGSPERQREMRRTALEAFLADHDAHPHRYVAAELPRLPFADASFDLALCSHLLFTWAEHLDEDWHEAALREMARVAREVRVYPLVHQGSGGPVGFLASVRDRLADEGRLSTRLVPVPFRFQARADEMLVVDRSA
jgi:hypothetical protein